MRTRGFAICIVLAVIDIDLQIGKFYGKYANNFHPSILGNFPFSMPLTLQCQALWKRIFSNSNDILLSYNSWKSFLKKFKSYSPLWGTEESDTLLDLVTAGDLRLWDAVPGDMLLLALCSLKTLGDCAMWVKEADWQGCSHVLQYAFLEDSGERCWLTPSIESGVPGPDATGEKAAQEIQENYFICV